MFVSVGTDRACHTWSCNGVEWAYLSQSLYAMLFLPILAHMFLLFMLNLSPICAGPLSCFVLMLFEFCFRLVINMPLNFQILYFCVLLCVTETIRNGNNNEEIVNDVISNLHGSFHLQYLCFSVCNSCIFKV